jgi:hypothetical protein
VDEDPGNSLAFSTGGLPSLFENMQIIFTHKYYFVSGCAFYPIPVDFPENKKAPANFNLQVLFI